MGCKKQENHAGHICQIKLAQNFDEIKKLKKDATHFCEDCEAPTNDPDKVCRPKSYEGKAGVLKWKA